MRKLAWLVYKDVLAEARSLERLSTLAVFATVMLVTLNFSLPADLEARPIVAAGFVWAAILLAAMLEVRRSFETERRDGTLDGLRAAPIDTAAIFAAKALSSALVLGALACALVPLAVVLFGADPGGIAPSIGVTLLGIVGLVAWGTLFAAVAGGSRGGEIVLPLLLFPLVVPQTIACVALLGSYLAGRALDGSAAGFLLLGAFDVISLGTSLLLFDYVLDE